MAPKALGQELEQGGYWPQKVLVPHYCCHEEFGAMCSF